MLKATNIGLKYSTKTLFENVNIEFKDDNCYGLIGANGAGKSTFLKILSKEIESTTGDVSTGKDERISFLRQNHAEFDDLTVIDTVIRGNQKLYDVMIEKNEIYCKEDFTDADGMRAGELEVIFDTLGGWQAESDAAILLSGLGVSNDVHYNLMKDLKDSEKVKVLLAQALFGDPDVLLLDEPTNGLDLKSKLWLEEYLIEYKNTVIVVSHDRHFLNKICTHIVDIDYGKITLFVGNYDFWVTSSELIQKQMGDRNKRKEEKIKELQDFIARFSANASKSKQATSRKKLLDNIVLDEIKPSTRKYPYVNFEYEKGLTGQILTLSKVCYEQDGKKILDNITLNINKDDKIALIGHNELAKTALLKIISGEIKPTSGEITFGLNTNISYFPKNHDNYFETEEDMLTWLKKFSDNTEEAFIRGFLGRMLFSSDEVFKKVKVLSGGEKVRCMLSKIMLNQGNFLLLDEPTNHLDIESITSLNNALTKFTSVFMISTHDQQLIDTATNRLVEIKKDGTMRDRYMAYEEYIEKFGEE